MLPSVVKRVCTRLIDRCYSIKLLHLLLSKVAPSVRVGRSFVGQSYQALTDGNLARQKLAASASELLIFAGLRPVAD